MTEFEAIRIGNVPFYRVGCRKCGEAGAWMIYANEKGELRAKHMCGHVSKLQLVEKPDIQEYSTRLFQ